MYCNQKIAVAKSGEEFLYIRPEMANRHGLIAGATGTGKTVTLKVMAESFSEAGVPVFLADVKGDLAGMIQAGENTEDMQKRVQRFGLSGTGFRHQAFPASFWDLEGKRGLPLRTTVSEMGPTLLSRLMGLTDLQADILTIVFKIADDEKLLLIDTKDLRSMLLHVSENAKTYSAEYGNLPAASINVITRSVTALEEAGADRFFGEPALDIHDWLSVDENGRGRISILDSSSLISDGRLYSTFMLWLLSELFEVMPEAGDPEKPRMVFFFDEAHLLFADAPKVLLQKIEQVVKLIRSKGIGVYFITQNPRDIPDGVLSQLGNKVQHALHAYTPADQKGLKAAADSFRPNPEFKTEEALQNLGIGEALVSFLDETGAPEIVKRAFILPPESRMGGIDDTARSACIEADPLNARYSDFFDRDSAYEFLQRKKQSDQEAADSQAREDTQKKQQEKAAAELEKQKAAQAALAEKAGFAGKTQAEKTAKKVAKSVATTAGGTVGREIGKAVGSLGGTFGKRLGGNLGASIGRGILGTLFGK